MGFTTGDGTWHFWMSFLQRNCNSLSLITPQLDAFASVSQLLAFRIPTSLSTHHQNPQSRFCKLLRHQKKQHPKNPSSSSCYVALLLGFQCITQLLPRNGLHLCSSTTAASSTSDLQLPDIPPIVVGRGPFSSRSCTTSASCVVIT